jgi:hypothetical protein
MERKLKHLEMIQGIVNRMASNSFLLKGWSLTLVAALIALSVSQAAFLFALVGLLPCLVFWGWMDIFCVRSGCSGESMTR